MVGRRTIATNTHRKMPVFHGMIQSRLIFFDFMLFFEQSQTLIATQFVGDMMDSLLYLFGLSCFRRQMAQYAFFDVFALTDIDDFSASLWI